MYYVYILSNWDDSVLYIGVTSNLPKRLYEHKNGLAEGFTKKYKFTSWCILKAQQMCTALLNGKSN